jgi:hypothetical protein
MIIKDGTNAKVEKLKKTLKIKGDVYIVGEGNYIENLAGHKKLYPTSSATSIEEAEAERLAFLEYEAEQRAKAAQEAAEHATDGKSEGNDEEVH